MIIQILSFKKSVRRKITSLAKIDRNKLCKPEDNGTSVILNSVKIFFKNEGKIKTFSDKKS